MSKFDAFRWLFPGVDPASGTADHWHRLARVAFAIQNDSVDAFERHTPHSRRWARIGDQAIAAHRALLIRPAA